MALLQKKKEIRRKAGRGIASAVCLLLVAFMAAGCGKVEEPIPVQLASGNVEEMQNGSAGEIGDGLGEVAVRDKESDPEVTFAGADKVDADENSKEPVGQDESQGENIQQPEETQPQSVGNAELEGNVRSIGADCFVAARHEVWTEENASYAVGAAPGYEKEEDLITVYVNQNCVWEFETVKNGGVNPEDVSTREGSFADLQEGIAISIKGSWQGDGSFLADSVVMMIFV